MERDKTKNRVSKNKKQTDENLISDSNYERIFENISAGIQLVDFKQSYLFINNEAAKQFEMDKQSVIGKGLTELFPRIINTPAFKAIEDSLTTKEARRSELRVITKNQNIFWYELSIRPVDEGILILSVDITEIKKSESLLKESQEFNQELLEYSPNPILVINADLSIRYANPAFLSLTGFKWQEIQGLRTPFPWWGPDEVKTYLVESTVPNKRLSVEKEKRFRKKNGDYFWVELNARTVIENGKVKYRISAWTDITKRKQLEEALKESESKFRTIVETAGEGIVMARPEGGNLYVNQRMADILGYSVEELIGKTTVDFADKQYKQHILRDRKSLSKGELLQGELKFRRKDGSTVWTRYNVTPMFNDQGEHVANLAMHSDITKGWNAEEALKASEVFSSSLLTNSPNPILVLNPDSSIRYVNAAMENISGYSAKELMGVRVPFPWWPAQKVEQYLDISFPVSLQNVTSLEREYCNKNGDIFWVSVSMNTIFDEKGQIIYVMVNWLDITERKQWEQALKESQQRLQQIFSSFADGIIILDLEGRIIDCNPSAVSMAKVNSREELLGKKFLDFIQPDQMKRASENLQNTLKLGSTYNLQCTFVRPDGTICPVEVSSGVVKDRNNQPLIMVLNFKDITERRQMEDRIVDLYEKEKSQREELQLEAKARGMFIDVLAHELRTPLTPILASTGMLSDLINAPEGSIQKKLCNNIYSSSEILMHRLEELLDLARYSRGAFRLTLIPTELVRFMEDVIKRFRPTLDLRQQHLEVTISHFLPLALIDPSRMEQVIINLLSNASKFSPERGKIYFLATLEHDSIVIEVRDEGIGISPEEQERLFQPYHRVEQDRQKFPGIGLGLAVAKQIVVAHGGKISVTSQTEKGSTFTVEIPLK